MFALRSYSSTLTTISSKRPFLCLAASVSTSTPTKEAPDKNASAAAKITMFDFANTATPSAQPLLKPQAFPQAGDDSAPPRRGFFPADNSLQNRPQNRPSAFKERSHLKYRLHCRASRNNTIVLVTNPKGTCLGWFSGGLLKFKGVNRASYEAGYQCAVAAFKVLENVVAKEGDVQVELFFKGFGQGREAMKTALLAVEGSNIRKLVTQVQDRTPIKIGGTRSPKARRL